MEEVSPGLVTQKLAINVVGCQFRQEAVQVFLSDFVEWEEGTNATVLYRLSFRREPDNPRDPDAIMVIYTDAQKKEHHIGYVATLNIGEVQNLINWADYSSPGVKDTFNLVYSKFKEGVLQWFQFVWTVEGLDSGE